MKSKHTGINIFNAAAGRFKQKEGYSLIEVLMAISILAVGMLAIASMQASGIRVNATASHITTRATWAQDRIETLMALPSGDTLLDAGNHQVTTSDNYTITWVVANNNPVANAKLITVTVTGYGGTTVLRVIKA
jgi:prepilin-type N-terminal cleavage/methylation domain-containing protein